MVQEKVRTSALLQKGSTISRNSASRQRPLTYLARASAAGKAEQQAEPRDPEAEHEGAAGQREIEALAEEIEVIAQRPFRDPGADGRHGEEAEIEHGRERQEHRERQPDIGGRGQAESRAQRRRPAADPDPESVEAAMAGSLAALPGSPARSRSRGAAGILYLPRSVFTVSHSSANCLRCSSVSGAM